MQLLSPLSSLPLSLRSLCSLPPLPRSLGRSLVRSFGRSFARPFVSSIVRSFVSASSSTSVATRLQRRTVQMVGACSMCATCPGLNVRNRRTHGSKPHSLGHAAHAPSKCSVQMLGACSTSATDAGPHAIFRVLFDERRDSLSAPHRANGRCVFHVRDLPGSERTESENAWLQASQLGPRRACT